MHPFLHSIRTVIINKNNTIAEIVYKCEEKLDGIELMGPTSGLSKTIGNSKKMDFKIEEDKEFYYQLKLEIKTPCEFRARGFKGEEEYWEESSINELSRKEDGILEIKTTDEVKEKATFYFKFPINYDIDLSRVKNIIVNISKENVNVLQVLVDLSIWIKELLNNPLKSDKKQYLPTLIKYLKEESRNYNSAIMDEIIRPIYLVLTKIIGEIIQFHEDDVRILKGTFEKNGYNKIFTSLPDKIKSLNETEIASPIDSFNKLKLQFSFV